MPLSPFHPLIAKWFAQRFTAPTEAQRLGWPSIIEGRDTLIAAPTGSGKTLAAFLACLDRLIRDGIKGKLEDATRVVYVSPLKALSNDVQRNLDAPLSEIRALAEQKGIILPPISALVRTGDTPSSERQKMVRRPPHILVTTPESLYLLLTAESSRKMLSSVETVIVDEIHAAARDKRGSHLALSLERLDHLCKKRPVRIGLSATQRPVEEMARFLVGTRRIHFKSDSAGERGTCEDNATASPQRPPDINGQPDCAIVDVGHLRELNLAIETPNTPLSAVCSNEQWKEVYERVAELIGEHRSTLIFVNTRRMAERVTHQLSELLGEDAVASHHGSLSKKIRLAAEARLKAGELKAVVATASLELGIDIGFIDLVIQIGSPRSIAVVLQRIGRSGHALGVIPKGRLFALTRDELLECAALIRAVRAGRLDRIEVPKAPLDILAQQIVAAAACEEWDEKALFDLVRGAYPYRELAKTDFEAVIEMLSEGFASRIGRTGAYLYRDRVHHRIKARRGARLTALTSGGAIPETAQYKVIAEPERVAVGAVDEDFAVESLSGDVFLLGNTSWRIQHVRAGEVVVADAHGAAPTIPFWRGEAPGRTVELSQEVSAIREEIENRLDDVPTGARGASEDIASSLPHGPPGSMSARGASEGEQLDEEEVVSTSAAESGGILARGSTSTFVRGWESVSTPERRPNSDSPHGPPALEGAHALGDRGASEKPVSSLSHGPPASMDAALWLIRECAVPESKAHEAVEYVSAQKAAVGTVPVQDHLLIERFFDESGGMQLVIHSPFGSRINRAWGLALRKRFCRRFDFELQASADDNGIVLSLGPQHSFPLEEVSRMIHADQAEALLTQAALAAPLFMIRWRWNATRALAVLRQRGGKKVPPPLQRMRADDLISAAFPAITACQDNANYPADIPVPDHPIVRQTMDDCLHEAMDLDGFVELLRAIEAGKISVTCVDTREPTPFSYSILNAQPYAFLDDAPLEERRARAVATRRTLSVESLRDLGKLDQEAIEKVRKEAWPLVRDADELHDTLLSIGMLPEKEGEPWKKRFLELVASGRATRAETRDGLHFWVAAERWPMVIAARPDLMMNPKIEIPTGVRQDWSASEGWVGLVRGRMEIVGPTTIEILSRDLGLEAHLIESALGALEGEGVILRGRFTPENVVAAIVGAGCILPDQGAIHGAPTKEWCSRRLLARIHRLTLDSLRRQIAPVSTEELLRFLLDWSHLTPGTQVYGRDGILAVIDQLQGFEIPAVLWEQMILPSRVAEYHSKWVDEVCLSGEAVWGRLRVGASRDASRILPISLMLREDLDWLRSTEPAADKLSSNAEVVLTTLTNRGALFFKEIVSVAHLLPAQVEEALWELAGAGRISGDGFGAIRSLTSSNREKAQQLRRHMRRHGIKPIAQTSLGGRWWVIQRSADSENIQNEYTDTVGATHASPLQSWAWQLLMRYGVFFRDLLTRESAAPPWKDLLPVYRRMESRGEIRGGRFVAGVGGEQFALPEVVDRLRQARDKQSNVRATHASPVPIVIISADDPMNLIGILTPGPKVPAVASNVIAYLNGSYVGHRVAGEIWLGPNLDSEVAHKVERALRSSIAYVKGLYSVDNSEHRSGTD